MSRHLQNSGKLQNNSINGAMLATIDHMIILVTCSRSRKQNVSNAFNTTSYTSEMCFGEGIKGLEECIRLPFAV